MSPQCALLCPPPLKPVPSMGKLYLPLPGRWAQPLRPSMDTQRGGTRITTSLAHAGTGHRRTSKGRAGPESVYRRETRLLWPESAAALDLALFCFSLQLSAVFWPLSSFSSHFSTLLFQSGLRTARQWLCSSTAGGGSGGSAQPGVLLGAAGGSGGSAAGRRGAPVPPRRLPLASLLAGTQPTLIAISILVAALCRQNRFCLYNESLLNINLRRIKWRQ